MFYPGKYNSKPIVADKRRSKGIYIGAPACYMLEVECRLLWEAFCSDDEDSERWSGGVYVVGSALQRADWRDIDVRLIMNDSAFAKLFPEAGQSWEHDARWLVMTIAISERLSKITGLPIDFQFQPQSHANERHHGPRNPTGLHFMKSCI